MMKPDVHPAQVSLPGRRPTAHTGQALLEVALLLAVFLFIAFGVVGIYRVIDVRLKGLTLARETARVMAEAPTRAASLALGAARFHAVAAGLGLDTLGVRLLEQTILDPTGAATAAPAFPRDGSILIQVAVVVTLDDLPLHPPTNPTLTIAAWMPIQSYASRPPA